MNYKILPLLSALILSAATLSAQTTADSIAIVHTKWTTDKPAKGIKTLHATFSSLYGGLQDIYMTEINLKRHPLNVLDHNGCAFTSEKAKEAAASAAINGTYFDIGKTGRSICLIAKDGKIVEYTWGSLGQLSDGAVLMKDDKVQIVPWDTETEHTLYPDGTATGNLAGQDVMVCGPLMLQDGKEVSLHEESHVMQKHPRSGIAVKGKKAWFVVIDGRDEQRAIGVTIPEFAHFMRIMKMESALNLDGGGSSTLWTNGQIQNIPSDKHGQERPVSNSIIAK